MLQKERSEDVSDGLHTFGKRTEVIGGIDLFLVCFYNILIIKYLSRIFYH